MFKKSKDELEYFFVSFGAIYSTNIHFPTNKVINNNMKYAKRSIMKQLKIIYIPLIRRDFIVKKIDSQVAYIVRIITKLVDKNTVVANYSHKATRLKSWITSGLVLFVNKRDA